MGQKGLILDQKGSLTSKKGIKTFLLEMQYVRGHDIHINTFVYSRPQYWFIVIMILDNAVSVVIVIAPTLPAQTSLACHWLPLDIAHPRTRTNPYANPTPVFIHIYSLFFSFCTCNLCHYLNDWRLASQCISINWIIFNFFGEQQIMHFVN